jgi:uncharacterized tellurite resistance protein B-like protein
MFRTLRTFFEHQVSVFVEEPEARHSLELAAAALLMEIGRADHDVLAVEGDAIHSAIKQVFHLSDDEIEDLVATAEHAVDSAVSLFDFTSVINECFDREQKVRLLEMLWAVAYADDNLDHYEEYYVRKIADLLHISHSDYIRTKHKAMPGR